MTDLRKNIEDLHLIKAIKSKDKIAFGQLYDKYASILYGRILGILKSEAVAQDVLQEVMLKVWKKIDSYDAKKASLLGWMLRIARNKAIDMYRSSAYQRSLKQENLDLPKKELAVQMKTDTIGIKELLLKLKPSYKEVIELAYLEGYTQAEIAKKLQLPLGTVKSRVRIGLRELRKLAKA